MAEMDEEVAKELKSLAAMCKRLGFKGRKAEEYIKQHMEALGYQAHTTVSYSRKPESGGKGGGFLGGLFGGGGDDSEDDDL